VTALYTTTQAAAILGLSPHSVKSYCLRYPDVGHKVGRDWLLTDGDIAFIRSRLGKRGRPKR
jgi:hypothetical protein